jgi:DNA-binding GntR family transcriptional regulator
MDFEMLDRGSKVPFYRQLCDIRHGRITGREWQPGDMIPAELDLMTAYEASRITSRPVPDVLARDGLIG